VNVAAATDEDLMRAFVRGNERAFAVLVDRHGKDVKAYALRLLRNAESAEDVFVETFTRVAQHRDRWEPKGTLRGWLFTIAHRLCLDGLRQRQLQKERHPHVIELELGRALQPSPEAEAMLQELAGELEAAIARLPEGHREVLLLRVVHGLSSEETAAIVGLDEEQVRSQLSYARKRVRASIEEAQAAPIQAMGVSPRRPA
jgi:RNA polymerase sigma-70 factor (ECF subfamily)